MSHFNICAKNCRLCLRDEKFQIPIFGEIGNDLQIALKMQTCLPIQVSKDDFFPKHICYKCLASLDQSFNLWKQASESEALVRNLTSKLSLNLLNSSSTNENVSKPKNRTIMLSSGGTLNEDTDSENDGPTNIIKVDTDSEDDHPPHNKTACVWLDGGEDDLMILDSSPDFLESLEDECKQPRDGNIQTSNDIMSNPGEAVKLPASTQRIPQMQTEIISNHTTPYNNSNFTIAPKIQGCHPIPTSHTNLQIPDSNNANIHMNLPGTNKANFQSSHNTNLISVNSACCGSRMAPHNLNDYADSHTAKMTFTPTSFQTPNTMCTATNASVPHILPDNYFTPSNTRSYSMPNTSNTKSFSSPILPLHSVTDVTNFQTSLDSPSLRLHSVMSTTNLQIPSNFHTTNYPNHLSKEISSISNSNLEYVNNSQINSAPPDNSGGHMNTISNSQTQSGITLSSVSAANNSQPSSTSPSTRLRSVSLFQMSPDSWRKFLKKE